MLIQKFARMWAVLLVIALVATGFTSALPTFVERELSNEGSPILADIPSLDGRGEERGRAIHSIVGTSTYVDATRYGHQRKLIRTDNNTLWAVYEDNNDDIWYSNSTDDGVVWSTPVDVGNSIYGCNYPTIATNGTAVYIAWQQVDPSAGNQFSLFFRRTLDGGATWDPPLSGEGRMAYNGGAGIPNGNRPAIAANGSNVYIAFEEGGSGWPGNREPGFISSTDGGATWPNHVLIYNDPADNDNLYMSLVVNNNSGLSLAWQRETGGMMNKIYFSRSTNNGTSWSAAAEVGRTTGNEMYPSMTGVDSKLYLVWRDNTAGNDEIVFRNSSNQGTSWYPDLAVNPTNVSADSAASDHPSVSHWKGQVFVMWDTPSDHANRDLYTRLNDSTQWMDVVNYTSDNLGNRYPNLMLDGHAGYFEWIWTGNTTSPYPVYYNRTYSEPNHPVLNWTLEAGYLTDGVDPDTGTTGHVYTYRVNYSSIDNFPPRTGYPQVLVDRNIDNDFDDANERITMTAVNSADLDYTDGNYYTYSTRLPTVGTYRYRFIAQDDHNRSASGEPTKVYNAPVVTSVNEPPILDWAETAGYANDGVNPDQGVVGKPFTFLIKYTDVFNESPAANNPKLLLDMDNNGLFNDSVDIVLNMTELTAADTTFANGKLYTCNYTFIQTGTYRHMFTTADLVGLTNTTPARSGPVVVAAGPPPVLSLTGETGYTADGVSPDQGYFSTDFEFRVKYSSSSGTPPAANGVKMWLDLNRNGTKDAGEWFDMAEADASADFVAGKVYTYTTKLSAIGTYNYSFAATDDNYGNATLGPYAGPTVLGPNNAPVLSWTGATFFETDGLDPESGNFSTVFLYRVNYTDSDNDAPAAGLPKVGIDRNRNATIDADEWFSMVETDAADTNCTNGKWYEYNTTFDEEGTYNYSFDAQDARGAAATGAPLTMKPGPTVIYVPPPDTSPELAWVGTGSYVSSGVAPSLSAPGTAFAWKVKYTDADSDGPAAGYPVVWIDLDQSGTYDAAERFEMVQEDPTDVNLVDGKVYLYTKILANAGSGYRYLFEAIEEDGGRAQNLSGTGPIVRANNPPTLDFLGNGNYINSGVSPATAMFNTTFTYMVKYNDSDGDMPIGNVTLYVDRDLDGDYSNADEVQTMTEVDPMDTNVIDGKEYRGSTVLTAPGTYKYRFSALDIGGLAAMGPVTVDLTGPIVLSEPPNLPPKLTPAFTQNMGLSRISGEVGTVFSFGVIYSDPEGDAAKAGWPRLLIDIDGDGTFTGAADLNLSMTQGSPMGGGTAFGADVPLKKAGTMHYKFIVQNVRDQWAELGPLDGPIVIKKAETVTTSGGGMTDFFWIIIVIIAFVVALMIGYAIGHKKPPEESPPEPEYKPRPRASRPRKPSAEAAFAGGEDEPKFRDSSPSEPPAGESPPESGGDEAPKGDEAPAENKPEEPKPEEKPAEETKPEEKPAEPEGVKKNELDDIINNLTTTKKEG